MSEIKVAKKVFVQNLVIEVTRMCNAKCEHCLRGKAECGKINENTLRNLFRDIDGVRTITFSGGEPTLHLNAVRQTLEICKENEIYVGGIYIVTNGVKYNPELIPLMNEWLEYCYFCEWGDNDLQNLDSYLENSTFGLSLSIDKYHPQMDGKSNLYRIVKYYSPIKENYGNDGINNTKNVIREGNAIDNPYYDFSGRFLDEWNFKFSIEDDDSEINIDEIYCNIYGELTPCCDMSYDTQRKFSTAFGLGENNVNYISIENIVKKYEEEEMDYSILLPSKKKVV